MSHNNIDIAIDWIVSKQAAYLCKEDKVVYFESITGNPDDVDWQELTLPQLQRILKYTSREVALDDIVAAFQELGEVYDMAVESSFKTPSTIFNYAIKRPITIEEIAVRELIYYIVRETKGITLGHLNIIHDRLADIMSYEISAQERNRYYRKYLAERDWTLREGTARVYYHNNKTTVIMPANGKVSELQILPDDDMKHIASLIANKLRT